MFSLGGPCNGFKIKWIEFSCSSKGGKSFSPGEILEYCKYQQEKRPLSSFQVCGHFEPNS
jgi:hypothetical protein